MATSKSSASLDVFLKEHLLYVHTKAEAGEYADAMAALQETKATVKDNVYVSAVEQQLVSLLDLSRQHALTDDRKAEFLEPITGIIERIIGSSARRQVQTAAPPRAGQASLQYSLSASDKQAALDRLKVEYFEQASRHLTTGEYKLALGEIQRVFVIEPENTTAKQYESIIFELMKLKAQPSSPMQPTITPREITREALRAFEHAPVLEHPEHTPVIPEEPGEEVPMPPSPPAAKEPPIEPADSRLAASAPVSSTFKWDDEREEIETPIAAHHVYSPEREIADEPRSDGARKVLVIAVALVVLLLAIGTVSLILYEGTTAPDASSQGTASPSPTELSKIGTSEAQHSAVPVNEQGKPVDQTSRASSPSSPSMQFASSSRAETATPRESLSKKALALKHEDLAQISPVVSDDIPAGSGGDKGSSQVLASPPSQTQTLSVPEAEPEPFVAVEKDPQIVKLERPQVPDVAWQGASELQIVVRVMIDEDGKPTKTKILKGENPLLQAAVIDAIMKSTFTPGIMGKSPVAAWLTIPFKFKRNG